MGNREGRRRKRENNGQPEVGPIKIMPQNKCVRFIRQTLFDVSGGTANEPNTNSHISASPFEPGPVSYVFQISVET